MSVRLLLFALAFGAQAQTPDNLRCDWQTQPVAIQSFNPRFSWLIKAATAQQGISQSAYRIVVSRSQSSLARHFGELWDTGKVSSSSTLGIRYAGKDLVSSTVYFWDVQFWDQAGNSHWSASASFQTALLYQKDWTATWISAAVSPEAEPGLPLLRREFRLAKKVSSAIVHVSGLGQYELHLNGDKIGNAVLAPGWTDYRKTVFYNTFDVAYQLNKGDNVFAVSLGNGMYNVERTKGRYTKFKGSFGPPKLLFQAQIVFTDGSSFRLVSDHTWRTVQGPTTFSSVYGGEDYDARLEQAGWDRPGFKDQDWLEAQETEGPGGKLISQSEPPLQVFNILPPVRATEPQPGIAVYDLGQNFAGWLEVSVKGPRGSSVKLVAAELLDREGLASQRSSGGPQWFTYTLKGQGVETWHPQFTYWGFRYVQVERQPDAGVLPELISIRGQSIHASAAPAGDFQSSDDLLNRIHRLIHSAIDSNLQSIVTDCPHREKLGWLEESHLLGSALMYNFDLATLYEKISNDMADAQQSDGLVPDIAPEYVVFEEGFRDSPEWGSAVIIDPWLAFQTYGDADIIASHYEGMKRYAAYLAGKASGDIIAYGLGDWYDVGPGEPGVSKLTSLGVTATAIYYQDLIILADSAKLLQKAQDEIEFRSRAKRLRDLFNLRFYNADLHTYDHSSQTDLAMPLVVGLAPEQDRVVLIQKLVGDIQAHNNHVTAGDIGFHYVVKALMDDGRSDVLLDILSRTDSPSYGYQLAQGATTLTEAWDANPHSSQNHIMLGEADEWFYRGLAGIDIDFSRPEGERLIIHPSPQANLTAASASYSSVSGNITSNWTRQKNIFTLTIDVPSNMSALVRVPGKGAATDNSEGVTLNRSSEDLTVYHVVSGHYTFRSHL